LAKLQYDKSKDQNIKDKPQAQTIPKVEIEDNSISYNLSSNLSTNENPLKRSNSNVKSVSNYKKHDDDQS